MATRAASLPLGVDAERWPVAAGGAAALLAVVTVLLLLGVAGLLLLAAAALLMGLGVVFGMRLARAASAGGDADIDWRMLEAGLADSLEAVAVTDRQGRLRGLSPAYEAAFGFRPPSTLATDAADEARLASGARAAMRDGTAEADNLRLGDGLHRAMIRRAGRHDDHLVWRLRRDGPPDTQSMARALLEGDAGRRLGEAGVMAVLADGDGRLLAANRVFALRATGDPLADAAGTDLMALLGADEEGTVRLAAEGPDGPPLRVVTVPVEDGARAAAMFLLLDEDPDTADAAAGRATATAHLHRLLAMLPLGLALLERDGRFLFANDAFCRAAELPPGDRPSYAGDIVIDEDRTTVIEVIRRFAAGRALPGDLAIRLKGKPDETVALSIANAKGLGDAAVLLSLKDTSEESTLKRQVAQATKMQAVGQLAGGVAHDFNNILTAIIGHCDLMLTRHTPGDIDYDDVQQIRHNSNRAAALTRQLLAFSRQQTLRPQILQLPDIISEVTNLLRRLLGETVKLEVKHGRNLGLVRADPGQLEQVIVNLSVNARDAMPDGGTLTLETLAVSAADVRRMGHEILPIDDYTALRVSDTGCGIAAENLAKIFEPFFTTKEVGKGTGLGLSTVYGIIKQTDGFIFAESVVGRGTSFMVYLPVHHAAAAPAPVAVRVEPEREVWGSGTILLVEDEAMVRAVAERALTRQGYEVRLASNGEEALQALEEEGAVDLLISDVVMPTMDGPTLVRAARQRFPDMPVLFMSGYAEEQLRQSIDIERVAFLPKPFSVQQLARAARDVLHPADG